MMNERESSLKFKEIEFDARIGAENEIVDMKIYLEKEDGDYQKVKDVCMDLDTINRRIFAERLLDLSEKDRETILAKHYFPEYGEKKAQQLTTEVNRQIKEIERVYKMSEPDKSKYLEQVEKTQGVQAARELKYKSSPVGKPLDKREKELSKSNKELHYIKGLSKSERKEYYAKVAKDRGAQCAKALASSVKKQRHASQGMEI